MSDTVRELFPEIEALHQATSPSLPELPTVAPAKWVTDRHRGETPPEFVRRTYEPWMGHGLVRADLKRLDPPLYFAMCKYLRHHEMPEGVDVPLRREATDRWLASLPRSETGDVIVPAKDIARFLSALRWRFEPSADR